jgi:hypothetical protein
MSYSARQVSLFILCGDSLYEGCERNSNRSVVHVMCDKFDVVCAVHSYMKLNTWVSHYHSQYLMYLCQFYIHSFLSAVYDALISSFCYDPANSICQWPEKVYIFLVYRQCFISLNGQYEGKLQFDDFYFSTVHLDNIKVLMTSKCTSY